MLWSMRTFHTAAELFAALPPKVAQCQDCEGQAPRWLRATCLCENTSWAAVGVFHPIAEMFEHVLLDLSLCFRYFSE